MWISDKIRNLLKNVLNIDNQEPSIVSESIHVKDHLLHVVGKQNQYHKFIIWADDSCYNRITGTVTITTFNGVSTQYIKNFP
jgi:hypothetical protein